MLRPEKRPSSLLARLAAGALALSGLAVLAVAPLRAEAANHPDLDLKTIETEHFFIHYQVSKKTAAEGNDHYMTGEWSARKAAQVAEKMWEPMCAQFNYYLKEKVHIVILNTTDDLDGYTVPAFDWIVISANPGSWFYRERGHAEWFSDVLVHEFAHVVSLKANGWFSEGSVVGVELGGLYQDGIRDMDSGADVLVGDGDSVFWTEGGAEYWSDQVGYNTWTSKRDLVIRTTVLEDRLLRYEEWHDRAGKGLWWRDPERYYQQGYSFGQYLRQRFGDMTYAKFAQESGKHGWRVKWEQVIEEVTGVSAKELYNDWVVYVKTKYGAQAEAIRAKGEVTGRELFNIPPAAWEYTTPEGRDKWNKKKWFQREKEREKTGRYQFYPRVSPDGKHFGINTGFALDIKAIDGSMLPAFSGQLPEDEGKSQRQELMSTSFPISFGDAWDFVPGGNAVVLTGTEDMMNGKLADITGIKLELDGYDWKQLYYFELTPDTVEENGQEVQTRQRKRLFNKKDIFPKGSWRAIPNTKRGVDPAVSPDGTQVAYFEYTDGTQNLVLINLDGSDKRVLTNYKDGTWFQQVDWSPDGKQLVFAMFRNYAKNLYTINADGTNLKPINLDGWEDQDAFWAPDGKIYFSSDPGGVFNIYSYDPKSEDFRQITNVINAAECPWLTPEGDLVYAHYTSFGWKVYGLARSDFLNADANAIFTHKLEPKLVAEELSYTEDLSSYQTTDYKQSLKNTMAPYAVPMFKFENDQQTGLAMQAGGYAFVEDYASKNGLFLYALLGEDTLFLAQYYNNMWYPTIQLTAYRYEVKYASGYLLDEDEDPDTTDDQTVWEIKNQQYSNRASLAAFFPWSDKFSTDPFVNYVDFGFKGSNDPRFIPYLREIELGGDLTFTSLRGGGPNTFVGRSVDLTLNHAWSDIVYEPYGGVAIDDGEVLDNYQYNKAELRWTENIRVPTFWGLPFMKEAAKHNHVIQVDTLFGAIDRNVDGNDELRAGGQHPYYWGSGTLRPNTQFAGFPAYSLSGETMAIVNLAYRFPISQYIAKKVGPLFVHGIFAQFGGTAGNLWSYKVSDKEGDTYPSRYGDPIARDPDDIQREIPFVDIARKNNNFLLYDAQAEIRVQSTLFHNTNWDSFVRLAWGLNEVRGYGDVDGDGVFDTSENAIGDELSNETEKPGPRIYIGLGTGW